MFVVDHALISDDVATFFFACDLHRCKGACCVVGDAGAPVKRSEMPILRRAYAFLEQELRPEARETVQNGQLILEDRGSFELACTDGAECVFVVYDELGTATCAIQQAHDAGTFPWPKPISCHLFPIRITSIGNQDFLNLEYVPSICAPACHRGENEGIGLAEFLKEPLIRAYGAPWYDKFLTEVHHVRPSLGKR